MAFIWDDGNKSKIQQRFLIMEIEAFFYQDLLIVRDDHHSLSEERFIAIGNSQNVNSAMFVCFTIRDGHIRVISARHIRKKEVSIYETLKKKNS